MFRRSVTLLNLFKMSAGLALLGIVNAITIDNQLVMMQNECYERLAIGERIPDENVYKILNVKTVSDCQFECSKANENCMSLSFGISSNGNTSCILSKKSFTLSAPNSYPENSQRDPDFDLFSKKMNCRPKILPNDPYADNPDRRHPNDKRPNYDPSYGNDHRPPDSLDYGRPSNHGGSSYGGHHPYDNRWNSDRPGFDPNMKPVYEDRPRPPIVTHGHDSHGGMVTSIITEIVDSSSLSGMSGLLFSNGVTRSTYELNLK